MRTCVHSSDGEWSEWLISGTPGAVTFTVFPKEQTKDRQTAAVIGIHSRRKLSSRPLKGKCDVLKPEGKGYCEEKAGFAARIWLLSGHGSHPEIIWEALASWYSTYFGEEEE